jgi:hypothetical protein
MTVSAALVRVPVVDYVALEPWGLEPWGLKPWGLEPWGAGHFGGGGILLGQLQSPAATVCV